MDQLVEISKKYDDLLEIIKKDKDFSVIKIGNLSQLIVQCFHSGRTLGFVGNGGSAAEAIHLAAEFTGHCVIDHRPLKAICLNESQSALTAIANDYGFEFIFSRMVEAHLIEGDILILLSTSGTSKNILNAITAAIEKKIHVVLWTGLNAPDIKGVDVWRAPSYSTPRIQEVHLLWGHALAETIEFFLQ